MCENQIYGLLIVVLVATKYNVSSRERVNVSSEQLVKDFSSVTFYLCSPLSQTRRWCHDLCIHSQTKSHIGRPNLQLAHGARPSTCSLPSACTAHCKLPSSSHFLWLLHFSAVEYSDWCWDTCWDIFSHR